MWSRISIVFLLLLAIALNIVILTQQQKLKEYEQEVGFYQESLVTASIFLTQCHAKCPGILPLPDPQPTQELE